MSSERAFVCFLFGRKRSQFVHARLCLCVCVYARRDRQSENVCSNFARTAANQEKLLNKIVFGVKALRKYRQMIKQTTTTATHEPEHTMTNMSKTCLIFLFFTHREKYMFVCVCVCLALIASGNVRIFGSFWKQMQAQNDEIQQEQQQTSTETDSRKINNGVNFIYICVNAE